MITVIASEEDGAAGGVDRRDRRTARLEPLVEAVAEAGEDEEGVVDADAETDHEGELRREVGGVEDVGAEGDQADPDAEGEESGDDRQSHRHDRAEGEQEDDDRGEHADPLREAFFFFASDFLDRRAAELDLQPVAGGGLRGVHDPFGFLVVEVGPGNVELDGRVGDLAVVADRSGAAALAVGAGDFTDVRFLFDFGENPLHLLFDGGRVDAGVCLEDDLRRFSRLRRELALPADRALPSSRSRGG